MLRWLHVPLISIDIDKSYSRCCSSNVVDTLIATHRSAPTIYFYCNYKEDKLRTTSNIIRSLLKQLYISLKPQPLDPKLLDKFGNGTSLGLDTSEELFAAALLQTQAAFVIVDALDECIEEERRCLIELFKRQLNSKCNVKFFLTSRDESDLRGMFTEDISYQISADDTGKDIKPFVTAKIENLIQNRRILSGNVSPNLKEDLIETINNEAGGMYVPYRVGKSAPNYYSSANSCALLGFYGSSFS